MNVKIAEMLLDCAKKKYTEIRNKCILQCVL